MSEGMFTFRLRSFWVVVARLVQIPAVLCSFHQAAEFIWSHPGSFRHKEEVGQAFQPL